MKTNEKKNKGKQGKRKSMITIKRDVGKRK